MIRAKHRRWLGALALAALLGGHSVLAAEQADDDVVETEDVELTTDAADSAAAEPEAAVESAAAADAGAGTAADDPPAAGNGPSPDVFVPTEEISEDFAVSFPVDI